MEFKGTKGEWNVKKYKMTFPSALKWQIINENDDALFEVHLAESNEAMEANAKLIADAGTTANKCGLMPSELLEQRNDLLEALQHGFYLADKIQMPTESELIEFKIKAKQAIEKALK